MSARGSVLILLAATAACRIGFDAAPTTDGASHDGAAGDGAARPDGAGPLSCGPWQAPTLVASLGGALVGRSVHVSADGLYLAWQAGGVGQFASRASRTDPFSPPTQIPGLGDEVWEVGLARGGRELMMAYGDLPACPELLSATEPMQFTTSTALTAGCTPRMTGVYPLADGLTAYSTDDAANLQVAVRASSSAQFTAVTPSPGITIPVLYPAVREDQLEVIFESDQAGDFDLYASERASVSDPWSAPVRLPINSTGIDEDAALTGDGTELYFDSERGGGFELYVARRTCS
ncbi:MAG: PD40 domain-containing protein [Kofleriaceae bacterium]|nr:PD40 domain-containing protein [Kofleriaceae bacterium]MBP6839059.1 PD40 domain-containing protein [Kofleriaceae bacterium]